MQDIQFKTTINKDIDFVFQNILIREIFEKWAKDFSPGSTYVGDIKQSGSINFIDDDKNGIGGFVSDIKLNEVIEFTFFYQIFGGKPVNLENEVIETFTFEADENKTNLIVTFTVPEEFIEHMSKLWNKGINEIKIVLESMY